MEKKQKYNKAKQIQNQSVDRPLLWNIFQNLLLT